MAATTSPMISRRTVLGAALVGGATLLSSCAARGELFKALEPPPAGKSVIYIYRIQEDVGRNMDLGPGIVIGGQSVGTLLLDGYIRVVVAPGPTYINMQHAYLWPAGAPLRDVQIQAKVGEMHFVAFEMLSSRTERTRNSSTTYLGVSLQETPRERAMFYLPRLKLLS